MNILTVDLETYYDSQYSLSKMTHEEYIRDERFEVIMVGLKLNNNPSMFVHPTKIPEVFSRIPWNEWAVLSHNSHFDMAILSWVYNIHPYFYLDTIPMMRALYPAESASLKNMCEILGIPPKGTEVENARGKRLKDFTSEEYQRYGEYCMNDVDREYDAFQIMKSEFPVSELRLIDLTTRLYVDPILELDRDLLLLAQEDELKRKEDLLTRCNADKATLGSNDKFAELLVSLGYDPPKKISPAWRKKNPDDDPGECPIGLITKDSPAWSYALAKTDSGMKDMLACEDPDIQALAEARLGVKSSLAETRIGRLIGISERGNLPVHLNAFSAHTLRYGGGSKVNLQNLPRSCTYPGCVEGEIKC